jgi:DNA-binding beta-propeller fold protein YncE
VQVIALDGDTLVGDIGDTPGVHGVALVPELGRGFTSNGRDSSVTVFDLKTLAALGTVKVGGRNPDAIIYDATTRRVFTFNGGSASATAIDAASGQVVGSVALGGKPEFAVSDGAGKVYVNIEDKGELVTLDPRALRVIARWPLAPCEGPTGLAIDRAKHRLFSVCGNRQMAVSDPGAKRVVATLPIGAGVDGVAFDQATHLAFSSNGEGTLTVVRQDAPDRYRVAETVPTQRGARTVALDPTTHRIFTATAQFGPPPAPTPDRPRPRPSMLPGSFFVLVLGPGR